jgi:pimeloyl-ACP methyl ester carboxylesterase
VGYRRLHLDRGVIEYLVDGPEDARDLLLFHLGTPCAAAPFDGLTSAAAVAGMRTAIYSRPGYGRSTRRPGRIMADEAATSAALGDHLGYERFFTAGWSGGGPVALACAALLPDRVRACLTLGSIAPWHEAGDVASSWFEPEIWADWQHLGTAPEHELIPEFEEARENVRRRTVRHWADDPRGNAADREATLAPGGLGTSIVASMRRGVSTGIFGFLDDNVAEARDWGFRVADIRVPVVIRHGLPDGFVNVAHGRWLAETIPGARGVFPPDAGHTSIMQPWDEVVRQLVSAAPGGR